MPTSTPRNRATVSLRTRISQLAPTLPPSMRRVAEAILSHPDTAANLTITELARECDTSETSVVRFCQAVGVSGYSELRLELALETGRETAARPEGEKWGDDIAEGDSLHDVVEKIRWTERLAIEETLGAVDYGQLDAVVRAIDGAQRIVCFGIGASYLAALDLAQKLRRIGRNVLAFSDVHEAMTNVALFSPGDVLFAMSHSGQTLEPRHLIDAAAAHGATTIALTNHAQSPAALAADHCLVTAVRESTFRSGAMASRVSQLALIDVVFVAVAQRHHGEVVRALEATKHDTDRLRG